MESSRDVWIEGMGREDSLGALIVKGGKQSSLRRAVHLQGHSFGTHSALKHGITTVTTIHFSMGSVAIMTYSWHTLSYWPDRKYWFIEETSMLSWQPEVMVGGNRAGDGEGCSLSFELYCCYRFPIRKKDGPRYWPTTSMKVCFNHTGQQRPSPHRAVDNKCDPVQWLCGVITCMHSDLWHACCFMHPFVYLCLDRIVCEMAAAPKGSAPGPVKLCIGECRPELRTQSSQLYSFVVILNMKNIYFVNLCQSRHQVFAMN